MEGQSSSDGFTNLSASGWPMNDVRMSDPLLGLDQDNDDYDGSFDSFMHSLGDQGEQLLTEETVKQITEILTPAQQNILEEKATTMNESVPENRGHTDPCFHDSEHAQIHHAAGIRPCHGGTGEEITAQNLVGLSSKRGRKMQQEGEGNNPVTLKQSSAIQMGLQKIKEQLDKGGKFAAPQADAEPAVVTEFIGGHVDGFTPELDETSKGSVDSLEGSTNKDKEADPPVRRSGRKTVRLFEITGPKRGRKKADEEKKSTDEPRQLRGCDDSSEGKAAKKTQSPKKGAKVQLKEPEKAEEKEVPSTRRSNRNQKEDEDPEGENAKGKASKPDVKETRRVGRPKKSIENEKSKSQSQGKLDEDMEPEVSKEKTPNKKSSGRQSVDNAKSESGSEGTGKKKKGDKESESDGKSGKGRGKDTKRSRMGRPPGRRRKGAVKNESTKSESGRKRSNKKKEEGKKDKGEGSSSDESVLDDGELSDDGSEFDPDEDPDRPWCICRKPHGNRFMICCDTCEDWFHGDCVGVTQSDGKELEKRGEEWMCPKCKRKLQALAKELKEKERQERIKNREKSEGSSDESNTSHMRKKLLKALEKELASGGAAKAAQIIKKEDHSSSSDELGDDVVEEEEEEQGSKLKEESKEEKIRAKKRMKAKKEDREAVEAKRLEKELEWKRQLKEMKERAKKAEMAARRRDSIEGQMTFDKVSSQKTPKKPEVKLVKQESVVKKGADVKKETGKGADEIHVRRKSDSSLKSGERKRSVDGVRRVTIDVPKEKSTKSDAGPPMQKKVRTTPTPKTSRPTAPMKYCIVCNKPAMRNAVYCSKECITSYTKESLRLLSEDKQKRLGPKSPEVKSPSSKEPGKGPTISPATSTTDDDDKNERIPVIEKSTKKVIAGLMAPTRANIFKWVEEHPTFEVFRPAATKAGGLMSPSFYSSRKSESTANSGSSNQKDKKDLTEVVRNNVKKSLKETILTRYLFILDLCLEVEMDVNVDEVTKICSAIEEEIVKMYGDTGQKYKTKYRSLIFNLKDPKNRSLYKQVVQGELPPAKLVHMSPEQLASAELAKWREREAKHNIEMIKKREEEDALALKHAVKKTHKGEVELENEGEEDMHNLQTHIETAEEQKDAAMEEDGAPMAFEDTTEQHSTHLFDLNCKICTGKQQPAGEKHPILPHVSTSVIQAIPESSMPSPTDSPDENDLRQNSPDLIESMNRSPIHIPLPSKEKSDPMWKGFVVMPSVAKFASNAYRISGPCDNLLKLLPDTLQIYGRIKHEQVWDYLFQLKSTTHKTIDVLRFEMAAEDDKKDYVALYSYFYTRKRIGVIGNCHSGVKDMYVVPIASHDPVPPELQPFDGPGMPEPRPHMLIGIIVRSKQAVPMKRPKQSHHESTEVAVKKSKKRHKHKKDKYEDIVFGKQRAGQSLEETPSESGSSYTPSYTPDIMSPPSTTPSSALSSATASSSTIKTGENREIEDKLERQKQELLKLEAEIRKISGNQALGIPTPTSILAGLETSSNSIPSSQPASLQSPPVYSMSSSDSASTVATASARYTPASTGYTPASVGSTAASTGYMPTPVGSKPSVTGYTPTPIGNEPHSSGYTASSAGYPPTVPGYTPTPTGNTSASTGYTTTSTGFPSTSSEYATTSRFSSAATFATTSTSSGNIDIPSTGSLPENIKQTRSPDAEIRSNESMVATRPDQHLNVTYTPAGNETKKANDGDEPYDPEDDLDTAIELESKDEKKAKAMPPGDEPYDPEDDFVLDLIEDITLPSSLKKIDDKPNKWSQRNQLSVIPISNSTGTCRRDTLKPIDLIEAMETETM
eukprot:gene8690-14709_t